MMKINCFGKTDPGRRRVANEDVYAIGTREGFCLVADGMGGAAAGEVASYIFAQAAQQIFSVAGNPSLEAVQSRVENAFHNANQRIIEHVNRYPDHHGMGCTAELLAFTENGFVIGHMGDSRTYLLRDGQMTQLTRDHSLVQEQLDQGLITPAEARSHPMRHVILRAVGVDATPALDLLKGTLKAGDLFLLCSDGLSDMIEDREIEAIIARRSTLSEKAAALVESANSAGGKDNVTVVLAHFR
jgi:serine/threonine protein phosphatase PrpC